MTRARNLVHSVVEGLSPTQALLTEAEAPSWKPGQPVPEGYKIVFGRLAKIGGSGVGSTHGAHPAHDASTGAYRASSTAKSGAEHLAAARAHMAARAEHIKSAIDAEKSGYGPSSQHYDAANEHFRQSKAHEAHPRALNHKAAQAAAMRSKERMARGGM